MGGLTLSSLSKYQVVHVQHEEMLRGGGEPDLPHSMQINSEGLSISGMGELTLFSPSNEGSGREAI